MKAPSPQPRRRDAALIIALLLVLATVWLTVLGPMSGAAGWQALLAVAVVLAALKLADPLIRRFSRWIQGKGKRQGKSRVDR